MGYRSDVRIIMSKKAYEEFKRYVEDHIRNYKNINVKDGSVANVINYNFNLLKSLDIDKETNDRNQVYIGWNYLKWYDGYEEVDAIMDSLTKLEENGFGYRYSRIGENYEDFEEQESDDYSKDAVNRLDYIDVDRSFCDDYFSEKEIKLKEEREER